MTEIIHLPKRELDPGQRSYFHGQAAYWSEVQEIAQKQVEYAQKQREYALQMLGMIGIELTNGDAS